MDLKDALIMLLHSGTLDLTSTHQYLSLPVIERIYKKMKLKLLFGGIRIERDVIVDGHHRYLASSLAGT